MLNSPLPMGLYSHTAISHVFILSMFYNKHPGQALSTPNFLGKWFAKTAQQGLHWFLS
jgi:hypothetical protein